VRSTPAPLPCSAASADREEREARAVARWRSDAEQGALGRDGEGRWPGGMASRWCGGVMTKHETR